MDYRRYLGAYMYKAAADINTLIDRYASWDTIIFIDDNDKQTACYKEDISPDRFIELIWENSFYIDKEGNKRMLYFNHKLLSLSAYHMNPVTNSVGGLLRLNGFHITGAMKMMDSLSNSGLVNMQGLLDKSYDYDHFKDKAE